MALTLLEAAKKNPGDVLMNTIVEIYAQSSDILRVMPFESIAGNSLKYNQEGTLPGIGFRGVNEGFSEATGVINPVTEPLVIAGGDLDVDKFIIDTMGGDQRAAQEAMKVKALAHNWSNVFIKGDSVTNPNEFDGLQVRLGGSQLIAEGSTSGGDPLQLQSLDQLIDAVDDPTHLVFSQALKRRLSTAARNTNVGGHIEWTTDSFGNQVLKYQGLPILIADRNADNFQTLAFNEASSGGGTTGTSVYCLSLKDQMLMGIQNGVPDVRDLGELEGKPSFRTRIEWYTGIALFHPRAAARLWSISDAPVIV